MVPGYSTWVSQYFRLAECASEKPYCDAFFGSFEMPESFKANSILEESDKADTDRLSWSGDCAWSSRDLRVAREAVCPARCEADGVGGVR